MASVSKNTIVILIVIGLFVIADIILAVFLIIEAKKYQQCRDNEGTFCLSFSCPYPYNSEYKPFTNISIQVPDEPVDFTLKDQVGPDPTIAGTQCLGFPYRLIDPSGSATDPSNIACRISGFAGIPTNKATTAKSST